MKRAACQNRRDLFADIRRFYLFPEAAYSLADLARVWRIALDDAQRSTPTRFMKPGKMARMVLFLKRIVSTPITCRIKTYHAPEPMRSGASRNTSDRTRNS